MSLFLTFTIFIIWFISSVCLVYFIYEFIRNIGEKLNLKTHLYNLSRIGFMVGIILLTTIPNDKVELVMSINKNIIEKEYIKDTQYIITKHSGYNKHKLVNIKNGYILNISENNFARLNCKNYNLNVYNTFNRYKILGLTYTSKHSTTYIDVVCE